jgi:FKBP-type peptidyl-prolyl cis-trans isomerase FklB
MKNMNCNKIILAALVLMAGAALAMAAPKKNAKKNKKDKVVLVTPSDSLSYVSGYANTRGMVRFLKDQMNVDSIYLEDVIQGIKEATDRQNDPKFKAYKAGLDIAEMISGRIVGGIQNELKDAPDSLNVDLLYRGFYDALDNDTSITNLKKSNDYYVQRMAYNKKEKDEKLYGARKASEKAWLEENAKKPGVITLPSGVQYKVITEGKGAIPTAEQEDSVKYAGHLIDGTEFDSSYKRKNPVHKFRCNRVIKGWTEALTHMPVGSKWEIYIPYDMAYGDRQSGKIPPYSALIFTVELVDITPSK